MNAHQQQVTNTGQATAHDYAYDNAGRLTTVTDTNNTACTVRAYGFDTSSNRTGQRSATAAADACPPAPALGPTPDHTYDSANRLTDSGYVYDAFGRTITLPGTSSIAYYTNDLVQQVTRTAGDSQTWTLDPALRFRAFSRTVASATTVQTNHYAGDGDSPSWISTANGISRNVIGIDGNLVATTTATGGTRIQITNSHGDVIQDIDPTGMGTTDVVYETDEYGNPAGPSATRYGWLGASQRSTETPSQIVLMGVRLYAPTLGRFLQTDPFLGGSANPYDYCIGDPVGCVDLDGFMRPVGDHGGGGGGGGAGGMRGGGALSWGGYRANSPARDRVAPGQIAPRYTNNRDGSRTSVRGSRKAVRAAAKRYANTMINKGYQVDVQYGARNVYGNKYECTVTYYTRQYGKRLYQKHVRHFFQA